MAQTFVIQLSRADGTPWGFRLQGGKDFGVPLSILKVNGGSIAEKAGLQAGDGVLKVNNQDTAHFRHKEAQDAIIHTGNNLELLVQRGKSRTWQPKVTPVGDAPTVPQPVAAEPQMVTQTSLKHHQDQQGYPHVPIKMHNAQPTPFSHQTPIRPIQVNGTMKAIVNNQYNSPVALYSEENIAETLSAQAEVLAGGVLGVNFKKNEKPYSGDNSEVLKMVQQMDQDPGSPGTVDPAGYKYLPMLSQRFPSHIEHPAHMQPHHHQAAPISSSTMLPHGAPIILRDQACLGQQQANVGHHQASIDHYQANIDQQKAQMSQHQAQMSHHQANVGHHQANVAHNQANVGHHQANIDHHQASVGQHHASMGQHQANVSPHQGSLGQHQANVGQQDPCNLCEGPIVGVFVRVKGRNLHVECFKCATCGSSLKNVGYYSVNEKLYCDIHARQVASKLAGVDPDPALAVSASPMAPAPAPVAPPPAKPVTPAAATSFSPRAAPKAPMLPTSVPTPTIGAVPISRAQYGGAVPFGTPHASKVGPVPFHAMRPMSHVQYPGPPQVPSSSSAAAAAAHQATPAPAPPTAVTHQAPPAVEPIMRKAPPSATMPSTPPVGGVQLFPTALQNQAASVITACSQHQVHEGVQSSQIMQEVKRMESCSYSSHTSTTSGGVNQVPSKVLWPPPREDEVHNTGHQVAFPPTLEEAVLQKKPQEKPMGSVAQTFARAPTNQAPSSASAPPAGVGSKAMGQKWTPRKGKGVLTQPTGSRIPVCHTCHQTIRGPFVTALNKTWCPKDFVCAMPNCGCNLQEIGFVEEQDNLVCENCWGSFLAPECDKCHSRIKAECMKAIGKFYHPACFSCAYCKAPFGADFFYLEDGLPYCEADWNELFTTKCFGCGFPIGAGDHWVEALNNSYHTQCFKCSVCHKNLEGEGFVNKGGRPHCKAHAR